MRTLTKSGLSSQVLPRPTEWIKSWLLVLATLILGLFSGCGPPRDSYSFRAQLPSAYSADEEWPLLIYLHGASTRHKIRHLLGRADFPEALAEREEPLLLVAPRSPMDTHRWDPERVIATIEVVAGQHSIDRSRIYVVGDSQGGFGAWKMARAASDTIAAIVPVAGGGDPETACEFAHVPIWAFHGELDESVPEMRSASMIEAVRACGGTPRYEVIPGRGHDIDRIVYSNEELYSWLLAQSLD